MVEHALQGEDTSLSVIDFIASGEFRRFRTIILSTLSLAQIRRWRRSHGIRFENNSWKSALIARDRTKLSEVYPVAGR
jgi:hypothetical protein